MEENRRFLYKPTASSAAHIRDRSRETFLDIRKDKREKIITTKRFRSDSSKTEESAAEPEYTAELIKLNAKLIQKKSPQTKEQLKFLRNAFSYTSDFVDAFFEVQNSLHTLVGHLTGNDSTLQLEAAWCITNIAANDHTHMVTVVKAAGPYLITYLQSGSTLLQDQSSWALGNMAADSHEIRELLKSQGILAPLITLVESDTDGIVQSSLFALCNMARSRELVVPEVMDSDFPNQTLKHLSNSNADLNVVGELAWLLTYLTTDKENCALFVNKGTLQHLVHWLCKIRPHQQEYFFAVTPLLRCLGNIIGCEHHTYVETVLSLEDGVFLQTLNNFLVSNKRYLIKECLWVLSNIWVCPITLDSYVEDIKFLIPNVSKHLTSAYEIKKEAAICLCNLTCHGQTFLKTITDKTILSSFLDFLKLPDVEIVCLALQFFELILSKHETGNELFMALDGPSFLEALEYNETEEIRTKAIYLLETYYENEEH